MFVKDEQGFTLTELIVVMAIFLTIMLITANSFKTIVNQSSQQSKSAETQIQGIVGLEVLRADLEQAGFGLPWSFQNTPNYQETTLGSSMPVSTIPATGYWSGQSPSSFNDAPPAAPRAVQSANTNFNSSGGVGAQYLVIKSTVAGSNAVAKRWTNVSFANGTKTPPTVWGDPVRDFAASDRVVVIKNNLVTTPPTRQLMVNASTGNFSATFDHYSTLTLPHLDGDTFQVYGIGTTTVGIPFNRADYYVARPPNISASCASGTGVLYKSNISPADGSYNPVIPLLDCVADMQVVYGLDTNNLGLVNYHTTTAPATADAQRAQIREIRVYILAQDGKKDINYTYPSSTIDVGEYFGGVLAGRTFNFSNVMGTGSGWENYRWKVYTIVARPKNLIQ